MQPTYVVTDTEFDGPIPGWNSLLSIGAAAVDEHGAEIGCFEAVLQPLAEARPDPGTLRWFATEPEAWAAATLDPQPADTVMRRFADWVRSLPGDPVFAAHPVAVDAAWIDHYLLRFTGDRVMPTPRAEAPLFRDTPFCLYAFAAGRLGWPPHRCRAENYPADWLGQHPHNHRALDDARGYGRLLARLMGLAPVR